MPNTGPSNPIWMQNFLSKSKSFSWIWSLVTEWWTFFTDIKTPLPFYLLFQILTLVKSPFAFCLDVSSPSLWQFVTSSLAHSSLLHLLGNSIMVLAFGCAIGEAYGPKVVWATYLASAAGR